GCLFYGCVVSSVLAVLILVATGVGLYLFYRWVGTFVDEYTATMPRELPKVEMPEERRVTLKERVDAFKKASDAGTPTEPLVLDSNDLNALIEDQPKLNGRVFVTIDGDRLKGQVSIPLDTLPLPLTSGRFLNGEAELKASLEDGVLVVTLESIEVNGK